MCKKHDKELMLVHFDPYGVFQSMVKGEDRYDQKVMDFIDKNRFRFFDMNKIHLEDYKKFNLSINEYMERYFIGHYKPSGTHFFDYSIKNAIVDWLQPKPITYLQSEGKLIRFDGYLQK